MFTSPRRSWDIMFVPIEQIEKRDEAVAWAIRHRRVPYNFPKALVSPFVPPLRRHAEPQLELPDNSSLFCSQAVVRMLQISRALNGYFDVIIAENITPAVLYKILVGMPSVVGNVPAKAIFMPRIAE
eukprot:3780992-Rhodomonas_salina.1